MRIVETLLVFKADTATIKGKSDPFKDQTVTDLALNRSQNLNQSEVYNLIKDFLSDSSLSSTTSSAPNSPLARSLSSPDTNKHNNSNIINALDSLSLTQTTHNNSQSNISKTESAQFINWSKWNDQNDVNSSEDKLPSTSLLWPQPQICTVLSESFEDRFLVNDARTKPFCIYIKPPNTYSHMDFINKLASSFSGNFKMH